ncbi:MAG: ABC transporter ATP-binding protein [Candidatus Eisenbacteria bacterium]|nr:ABC transporter ATP-binding protein [Candidatus Eisenbacteria bacterium]
MSSEQTCPADGGPSAAGGNILEIAGLEVGFPSPSGVQAVLRRMTLAIPRNGITALVGESGCGKTVTMRACLGLLDPASSAVTVERAALFPTAREAYDLAGLVTRGGELEQAVRRTLACHVAVVFQSPEAHLNPYWTVRSHFLAVRRHRAFPRGTGDAEEWALHWLSRLRLTPPGRYLRRYPHELSGGEAVRLALGLALARRPALLIADEPTAGLDPIHRYSVGEVMEALARDADCPPAILLISHDQAFVRRHAERVAVMRAGRIVEAFEFARPAPKESVASGSDASPCGVATGSEGPAPPAAREGDGRPVLLSARGVWKVFSRSGRDAGRGQGPIIAVRGVTETLCRGERVAVVGASGCGKTTLARLLAGLLRPSRGFIATSDGRVRIGWFGSPARFHARVALLGQELDSLLHPYLAIGVQLERHARRRTGALDARGLAAAVGLPRDCLARLPRDLSGGERRRAGLAQVLAIAPELLIADEPFSGLDASSRARLADLLRAVLDSEARPALLLLTHDLSLARSLAERVLIMHEGTIVERMPARAFTLAHAHHPYAMELLLADEFERVTREQVEQAVRFAAGAGLSAAGSVGIPTLRCPYAEECPFRGAGGFAFCESTPFETRYPLGPGWTNCALAPHLAPPFRQAEAPV